MKAALIVFFVIATLAVTACLMRKARKVER